MLKTTVWRLNNNYLKVLSSSYTPATTRPRFIRRWMGWCSCAQHHPPPALHRRIAGRHVAAARRVARKGPFFSDGGGVGGGGGGDRTVHSRGPPTTSLQLVRVVRTGKMAGPRITRCFVLYCVAFAAAATASRADGIVYEKIPLGEYSDRTIMTKILTLTS